MTQQEAKVIVLARCRSDSLNGYDKPTTEKSRARQSAQIAIIMVAVVRPWRSNHVSEYLGPRTWKMGCEIEAINYPRRQKSIPEALHLP